jgi:sugar phosphate isomerase/epimerase
VVGFAPYRDLAARDPDHREREIRQFERWIRLAPALGTTLVATESGHWNDRFTTAVYRPDENAPPEAWA